MSVRDLNEQVTTLAEAKARLQEELDCANSKLAHLDTHYVTKDRVAVLESKCLEVEQKLDYEKSMRTRFEVEHFLQHLFLFRANQVFSYQTPVGDLLLSRKRIN